MSDKKHTREFEGKPTEELVISLGREARLFILKQPTYSHPGDKPAFYSDPYPASFYLAQSWLRQHRAKLQVAIIETFDYGSKLAMYTHGNEIALVEDLSDVIGPICSHKDPVNPALVAVLLLRIGLGEFCKDYQQTPRLDFFWSLEEALGWNRSTADAATLEGDNLLIDSGDWKGAIASYERAVSFCPVHLSALNGLAYVYAEYLPNDEKGVKYAKRVAERPVAGDPNTSAILDTLGWAYYKQERKLDEAEKHLRASLELKAPTDHFFITTVFHLMAVLKDKGNQEELSHWHNILQSKSKAVESLNSLDRVNYQRALDLLAPTPAPNPQSVMP